MNRLTWIWLCTLALFAGIKVFSFFPDAVEHYYSQGIFRWISLGQQLAFGWLPFSIGDCLYVGVILWLLFIFYRVIRMASRPVAAKAVILASSSKIILTFLWVYIAFNVSWGLNYNRRPLIREFGIDAVKVTDRDIVQLMHHLAGELNKWDSAGRVQRMDLQQSSLLFESTAQSYQRLSGSDKRFHQSPFSIKSSLFGDWGNYFGYTGYYNPFTGEAQLNTTVPLFIQPYTSCHELGHQLGYARENEANFAGYLAARHSPDPRFRYSAYFEMYAYGRSYLRRIDSLECRRLDATLRVGISGDRKQLEQFYEKYQTRLGKVIDRLYDRYLVANDQPEGKKTYSQVVLWLAAYYKKYGDI